jgi:RNA polymerase sigma factor (sigma-70 family)
MKEIEPELNRSIEESPPDLKIQETEFPTVFGNQRIDPLDKAPGAGGSVNLNRLYQRGGWKMKCAGCPFATLCGMELVHDGLIDATRPDRKEKVRNIEALVNTFIDRRSLNKRRDCKCDSQVEFIEAGEDGETNQDEAAPTATKIPLSKYPSPERDPAQTYEYRMLLEAALLQLSDGEKTLFELAFSMGFKSEDVATFLGIEPDAARKRLERLRAKLRELLLQSLRR